MYEQIKRNRKESRDECKMNFQPLIWREPWLAPVIMNLRNVIAAEEVKTAGITPDGKTLYYNTEWWKILTKKEQLGVQIHEILHIVNMHANRKNGRTHNRWNIACDIAINHKIKAAGYVLPQGVLYGENDSVENIYERLPKEIEIENQTRGKQGNKYGNNKSTSGTVGRVLDNDILKRNLDGSSDCDNIETLEAVESAGTLAGQATTLLAKSFTPSTAKADWRTVLQNFVKSALGDDFDYLSYEFDEFGICEDILSEKTLSKICALVDESGSIEDKLYEQFLAELYKMSRFAKIYASGFTDSTELSVVPLEKYRRTMTGGTDVRVAYEQACNKAFDCIIILTDGYLEFPPLEKKQTIWAMPQSNNRKMEVII